MRRRCRCPQARRRDAGHIACRPGTPDPSLPVRFKPCLRRNPHPPASRPSKTSAKAAARSTSSGPARAGAAPDDDAPARKAAETQALAAARPFQCRTRRRTSGASHAVVAARGRTFRAGLARGRREHAEREPGLGQDRHAAPPAGVNANGGSLDRVRVDSGGQRPDDQPGRADRRQPELAQGRRCAGRRCSKTSSCARRSRTSTTSAFPSASCTRAAPARTATSSATSR